MLLVKGKGSAIHLKSHTGCQKSCEIFESLLILKSKIFYSYDIPYIFGYKSVNPASRVLDTTHVGHTPYSAIHNENYSCFLYRRLSKAIYHVQLALKDVRIS